MFEGSDILIQTEGQVLREIRIQRFWLDDQLVDPCNVVFLRFDHWFHFATGDARTVVRRIDEPEYIETFESNGKTFTYPIKPLDSEHPAHAAIGEALEWVTELVWDWDGNIEVSTGAVFHMTGNVTLAIYDNAKEETMEILTSLDELPPEATEEPISSAA